MSKKNLNPTVSIGLPVYNGAKFLRLALDSILAQTYTDFELIISDNASVDDTKKICLEYAANDKRIRYYRNKVTVGAARNHNRVFEVSTGKYFKWASYDDVLAPEFLEKCVSVLESNQDIALCHCYTTKIDENSVKLEQYDFGVRLSSNNDLDAFVDIISTKNFAWLLLLGVIRSSQLKRTQLLGGYISSDRTLLAEISLLGKVYVVPDCLFFRREHSASYTNKQHESYQDKIKWWSQSKQPKMILPYVILFREYLRAISCLPISWVKKQRCKMYVDKWLFREGFILIAYDVGYNLVRSPLVHRMLNPVQRKIFQIIGYK